MILDASMELSTTINETITQRVDPSSFQGIHTAYLQRKYYNEHFNLVVSTRIEVDQPTTML